MWDGGSAWTPLGVISRHSVGRMDQPIPNWLFPIASLLSSDKVIFHFFFVISTKKLPPKIFFRPNFLTKMVKIIFFSQILTFIVSKLYSVCFEKFFEVHYMSVCQKLTMLKFVPHPSHFWVSATSRLLLKRLCNSGGWSRAQMKA